MDCGGVFVKYVLFVFNILFVVRIVSQEMQRSQLVNRGEVLKNISIGSCDILSAKQ